MTGLKDICFKLLQDADIEIIVDDFEGSVQVLQVLFYDYPSLSTVKILKDFTYSAATNITSK